MNIEQVSNTVEKDVIVQMEHIYKSFPFVQAIDDGHFDLRRGEIHSLIGENGAGKSTLMKILYGLYPRDSGDITIFGEHIGHYSTAKAISLGIGMVHQEFMLVKEISVINNIMLGYETTRFPIQTLDSKKAMEKIQQYIDTYHLEIQPNKIVANISVGEMQRVEIIKALYRGADILILDEPTAVLAPQERDNLFNILQSIRDDGKTIVFISHKLNEVMEISDRITVMRNGKYITTVNKEDTSPKELARMMVGRDVLFNTVRSRVPAAEPVLQVKDLFVLGERNLSTLKKISFDVNRCEVLGIAGVEGNGQRELVEAITGLRPSQGGSICINGKDITNLSPHKVRKSGVAHIPEDRNTHGLNKEFNLYDNIIATRGDDRSLLNYFWRHEKRIEEYGDKVIKKYDIRPSNGKAKAASFSGGNAQKIVVAREVEMDAPLLIASQPTRGVDIGAIESIRKILDKYKTTGHAVLLVSADLDEILALSDRILVLQEGQIRGEFSGDNIDIEELGLMMTGGVKQ